MKRNRRKLMAVGYCLVFLLAGAQVAAAAAAEKAVAGNDGRESAYIPGVGYNGEFITSRLYYRNPRSAVWRRMSDSDNYREVVTCRTALASLETGGTWQGHLNQDGSCGPLDEPAHFALGNRINFDILLDQDVSSR